MTNQLRRLLALAMLSALLVHGPDALGGREQARSGPGPVGERVAGSFIVTLADGLDPRRDGPAVARDHGGYARLTYVAALRGFAFAGPDHARSALARDPRVSAVDPDVVRGVAHHDRVDWARHELRVRAHRAFHEGSRGRNTRVAVLDTGVSAHPAIPRIDRASGRVCAAGAGTHDLEGHGTAVAGVVVGVARAVTIVPVRVLDHGSAFTSLASEICGIDHVTALNTNADPTDDIDVVNLSVGGPGTCRELAAYCDAITRSIRSGAIYAVAAGNDSVNARLDLPASHPAVITVSALGAGRRLASFSNFGGRVDLTAPGTGIRVAQPGRSWAIFDGTSFSAPAVAGAVAVARSKDPTLSHTRARELLKRTGRCPDGSTNGVNGPCRGRGTWLGDPDGVTEPVPDLWRAGREA